MIKEITAMSCEEALIRFDKEVAPHINKIDVTLVRKYVELVYEHAYLKGRIELTDAFTESFKL